VVEGREHTFSAGGLYNGLFLLVDEETGTYWDHISGEALHGPLRGTRLESWPVTMTDVRGALGTDPRMALLRSRPGALARLMGWFSTRGMRGKGPFALMGTRRHDARLPRMENGLGVVVGDEARFYRLVDARRGLVDEWAGRMLEVGVMPDGVPVARWGDGTRPFQVFSRWYGFSLVHEGCGIWAGAADGGS
jgi:hypothetical protein